MQEEYQYDSLAQKDAIRVLCLDPGNRNEPLRCEIKTITLSAACEKYKAISYVWGSETDQEVLHIRISNDERSLKITKNAAAALRRFRSNGKVVTLWLDSVCINQKDNNEKSTQVPLMGKIYRQAEIVLIWLGEGPDPESVVQADNCVKALFKLTVKMLNNGDGKYGIDDVIRSLPPSSFFKGQAIVERRPEPDVSTKQAESAAANTEDADAQMFLIDNSQFIHNLEKGTWNNCDDIHKAFDLPLVQSPDFEALLRVTRNPWFARAWTWQETFVAQDKRIYYGEKSWHYFLLFAAISTVKALGGKINSLDTMKYGVHLNTCHRMLDSDMYMDSARFKRNFKDILISRRGAKCKFPCDIIYSLIGVASNCPSIQIDYQRSFMVTFAEATWQILSQDRNLSILRECDRDRDPNGRFRTISCERCNEGLSVNVPNHGDGELIPSSEIPTWVPDWREKFEGSTVSRYKYSATGKTEAIVSISADYKVLSAAGLELDTIESVTDALIENWSSIFLWLHEAFECEDINRTSYRHAPGHISDAMVRTTFVDYATFEMTEAPTRIRPDQWNMLDTTRMEPRWEDEKWRARWNRIRHAWLEQTDLNSLFKTKHGILGMAAQAIKPGDKVVVLLGGDVPFVLRDTGEPGHYTLVADCYVHGYMDGEALVIYRKQVEPTWDISEGKAWLEGLHTDALPFPVGRYHIH